MHSEELVVRAHRKWGSAITEIRNDSKLISLNLTICLCLSNSKCVFLLQGQGLPVAFLPLNLTLMSHINYKYWCTSCSVLDFPEIKKKPLSASVDMKTSNICTHKSKINEGFSQNTVPTAGHLSSGIMFVNQSLKLPSLSLIMKSMGESCPYVIRYRVLNTHTPLGHAECQHLCIAYGSGL